MIGGTSIYATTNRSRTGIDLGVVFFVGPQSTLLKAHTRSLGSLKTPALMMRRLGCSDMEVTDERPRYGHDVEMVMTRICPDDLMSKIRFVGYVPRSCNWSCAEVK